MKAALRLIVIWFNAIVLISIGIWGYKTEQSETTLFWEVTGVVVSSFIIFIPAVRFWVEKLESLFESED
jgi:uncharacterized membrane protein YjdF